jgi:hypothetical protein
MSLSSSVSSSSLSTALYCQPIGNSRSIKNIASRSSSSLLRRKPLSSASTATASSSSSILTSASLNHSPYYSFRLFTTSSSSDNDKKQTSSPSPTSSSPATTDIEPTSFKEKITYMWKNYGKLAIGTYFTIYVTTLGSLFFALDFDIFNAAAVGLDPASAIHKVCVL